MPVLWEFFKLVCIEDITNLCICGKASGTMQVLGEFFKLVCIEASGNMPVLGKFFKLVGIGDISYVSVERPVELCQF